jgi:hypothetical protein
MQYLLLYSMSVCLHHVTSSMFNLWQTQPLLLPFKLILILIV